MRVCLVLRSGGEYGPQHVERLAGQVREHSSAEIFCLSDCDVSVPHVPLKYGWPGWWSKMEMFRPDVEGDFLFMDLDTSVVGDLEDFEGLTRLTLLRDFYRPKGLGSGLMFLPKTARDRAWREWVKNPNQWMRIHRRGGDQAFLERYWLDSAERFQDVLPGQVVSYKADKVADGLPKGARVVCFHGKPRPWHVGW